MSKILNYFGSYSGFEGVFNKYGVAYRGYSLRKLDKNYTGACIKVRRDSDNLELDIGFVNNELDTVSLLSFVGSGNGYISCWFNQGTGGDLDSTVMNRQPLIVVNGVVNLLNGKPAVRMLNARMEDFTDISLVDNYNTYLLVNLEGLPTGSPNDWHAMYLQATADTLPHPRLLSITNGDNFRTVYSTGTLSAITTGNSLASNNRVLLSSIKNSLDVRLYLDNVLNQTDIGSQNISNGLMLGFINNRFLNGNIQEYISYNTDNSVNRSNINNDILNYY